MFEDEVISEEVSSGYSSHYNFGSNLQISTTWHECHTAGASRVS
jgi:hypothetical protein